MLAISYQLKLQVKLVNIRELKTEIKASFIVYYLDSSIS